MLTLLLPVTREWTRERVCAAIAASDIPRERCVLVLDAPGCEAWEGSLTALGFSVEVHTTGADTPPDTPTPEPRRARQEQMRTFTLPLVGDGPLLCLDDDTIVPSDVYARLSAPGGSVTAVQCSRYDTRYCGVYRNGNIPLTLGSGVARVRSCGHYCLLTDGATYRAVAVALPGSGQMKPIPGLRVDWGCICGHMTEAGVLWPEVPTTAPVRGKALQLRCERALGSVYRPTRRQRVHKPPKSKPVVMIPSYRGGPMLAEALRSALDQTAPCRLILLDTSGEGRAEAVYKALSASERRRVEFEAFPPKDDAGNAAHEHLRGMWGGEGFGCFLHDDDVLHPRRVEVARDYMLAHPECDVSFCGMAHFRSDDVLPTIEDALKTDYETRWGGSYMVTYSRPHLWGWTRESYHNPVCNPAKFMRPSVLDVPRPKGYISGSEDILEHQLMWAAGLDIQVIPASPHYLWRLHLWGEMANSGTPAEIESDLGFGRLGPNGQRDEEALQRDEFARIRCDMDALHRETGAAVWWVGPGVYEVDGLGVLAYEAPYPPAPITRERPLRYPVTLAVDCALDGRAYPKGSRVDRRVAVALKAAGQLKDPRIR